MLHSPLHSFKGLTSPFWDVFNTIKQKSVMEHVDIHTSACCVENVNRKNSASEIAPDKVIRIITQIPQATIVTHPQVTVQGQSHQIALHAQQLLNPSPNNMPTPINVKTLALYLAGYHDKKNNYLLNGFSYGFKLEFNGDRKHQSGENFKSALDMREIVDLKIAKEIQLGRVIGPFNDLPLPRLKISPLCLVPKKKSGSWRLVHNLSYPNKKEISVNAGISDEAATVQYTSIDDAIAKIKMLGNSVHLAKSDILSAFRIIPVHPDDYELLGFQWNGKYFVGPVVKFLKS